MQKHIAHTIPPIAIMIPKMITVTYNMLQSANNKITLKNKENHCARHFTHKQKYGSSCNITQRTIYHKRYGVA